MPIYSFEGLAPVIHETAYIHPTAVVIGDVIVGEGVYVGPGASLRGDFGRLIVEKGANVQDCCIMHSFPGSDSVIEENGHIGHGAVIHGARIGRNSLIGMNSVVMDKVHIGPECIVGAMSFVKTGMQVPARSLLAGSPARIIRQVTDTEIEWKTNGSREYQQLAVRSRATLHECEPLRTMEADRPRLPGDFIPVQDYRASKD